MSVCAYIGLVFMSLYIACSHPSSWTALGGRPGAECQFPWLTLEQVNFEWLWTKKNDYRYQPCYSPYSLCTFTYSSLSRCSVDLLYCCQSTNTNTWGASPQHYTYSRYPRSTRLNTILLTSTPSTAYSNTVNHTQVLIAPPTPHWFWLNWLSVLLFDILPRFALIWQLFNQGSWVLWRRCCVGKAI